MKARLLLALLVFLLPAHAALAGTAKQIVLKDGSVIKGEPVSLENGVYTIQTENLGNLQIPQDNVVTIASEGALPTAQPQAVAPQLEGGADFSGKVSAMQNQIMSDPQAMQAIQAMAEDPEISAMMADPSFVGELTAAVSGNNTQEIANNPKVQRLMSNPKIQALIQQIQAGSPQQ